MPAVLTGAAGKDTVLVTSARELAAGSSLRLPPPERAPGLLLPDGTINWACPCLGGMATGPCGPHFREAFTCFHYSEAEPKGSECYEKFSVMQECMSRFPELYGRDEDDTPAMPSVGAVNGADGAVSTASGVADGAVSVEVGEK